MRYIYFHYWYTRWLLLPVMSLKWYNILFTILNDDVIIVNNAICFAEMIYRWLWAQYIIAGSISLHSRINVMPASIMLPNIGLLQELAPQLVIIGPHADEASLVPTLRFVRGHAAGVMYFKMVMAPWIKTNYIHLSAISFNKYYHTIAGYFAADYTHSWHMREICGIYTGNGLVYALIITVPRHWARQSLFINDKEAISGVLTNCRGRRNIISVILASAMYILLSSLPVTVACGGELDSWRVKLFHFDSSTK